MFFHSRLSIPVQKHLRPFQQTAPLLTAFISAALRLYISGINTSLTHNNAPCTCVCLCTTMKLPRPGSCINHGTTGQRGGGCCSPGAVVTSEYLRVYSPRSLKRFGSLLTLSTRTQRRPFRWSSSTMNSEKMSHSCSLSNWGRMWVLLWFCPQQTRPAPTLISHCALARRC